MKLLAVETATDACSAALYINGEISERFKLAPREHTRLILPMVDSLMAEAQMNVQQLDAVAFGRGPGSFTGVRVATGVIQGIAFGADLPVVPVSTLAAMAQDCIEQTQENIIYTAMDARLEEIYWGIYQRNQDNLVELIDIERVTSATSVAHCNLPGFGIGSGWKLYGQLLMDHLQGRVEAFDENYLPKASLVAKLGVSGFANNQAVDVLQAMPVYLRNRVAKKQSERKL